MKVTAKMIKAEIRTNPTFLSSGVPNIFGNPIQKRYMEYKPKSPIKDNPGCSDAITAAASAAVEL